MASKTIVRPASRALAIGSVDVAEAMAALADVVGARRQCGDPIRA